MKTFKKLLSLALAVAMLGTTIVMPLSAGAADTQNLLTRKDLVACTNDNKAGADYNVITDNADGSITVTNRDTKRTSGDMMRSCGIAAQNYQGLQSNKTYKLSVDLKLADSAAVDSAKAYVGVTAAGNSKTNKIAVKSPTSQKVDLKGNAVTNITHVFSTVDNDSADGSVKGMNIRFYVYNENETSADKLYPDYTIVKYELVEAEGATVTPEATKAPAATTAPATQSTVTTVSPDAVKGYDYLTNGDMSDGNEGKAPSKWGAGVHASRNGEGTAGIVKKGGVDDSPYLLLDLVSDGTALNAIEITHELKEMNVISGKKYIFSVDAKVEGAESYVIQRIWLRNIDKNESLTPVASLEIKGSEWKTYAFELPATKEYNGTKLMIQLGQTGAKNVKISLDNIKLVDPEIAEAPKPTPKPNSYPVPPVASCIFKDCTTHWARNEIEVMQKLEVINGKSFDTFAPEDNITRAEFLALVTRAVGVGETQFAGCYPDVDGKWYANTVQAGFNAGVINPGMISGGNFEGDKAITREEMTSMIAAGYKILTGKDAQAADIAHFTDNASVSSWATEDVKKAYGLGIIKGITETTFEPKLNATRAQAAVMIYRLKNYGEKSYINTFDNDINNYVVTGAGKYTFKHDPNEGSSGKGSMLIDIENSGTASGAVQIEGILTRSDNNAIIEKSKKYLLTFAAKLDGAPAFPAGTLRCRAVGGGADHTSRTSMTFVGTGWKTYHFVLDGIDFAADTTLVFTAGKDNQNNFKLWLDDIALEEYTVSTRVSVGVADGLEGISNITGAGKYEAGTEVNLVASTKAGNNYLLDSWIDTLGNRVLQDSWFGKAPQGEFNVIAKYMPYTVTDKGHNAPVSAAPEVTAANLAVTGDTASMNVTVKAAADYKLAEAGVVFYNECYADGFSLFTPGAKIVQADTVGADGTFTASVNGVGATEDVLARAYGIYKDAAGNLYVKYSNIELVQRKAGEIKPYKIVSNYEMMAGYGENQISTYIGSDLEMMTITPGLYRTNMWRSEVDTQWKDYVHGESGEVGGDLEKRVEDIMKHLKNGRDLFQEMVTLGQQQDFDIFVNYRMNDSHRTENPTSQTHNRFYREHLDDLVVSGTARVLNYMDPEVREYYYRIVEELVTNYDVDGLELDFERYPLFFHAHEVELGTQIMTDFVGRVRAMLDRVGAQKGKYLPLSVRVRKSLASSLSVGLDVAEWDKRGYIDMINVTHHYYNTTELDVESYMNATKNARIHAELHYLSYQSTVDGKAVRQFCQPELLRATAANFLARGVDGITFFNLNYAGDFAQIVEGINQIKDPEELRQAEKLYNVAPNMGIFTSTSLGSDEYTLIIPDDTSSGIFKSAKMRVVFQTDATNEDVEVSINGVKLKATEHEGESSELFTEINDGKNNAYYPPKELCKYFEVPLNVLKSGENTFSIKCTTNSKIRIMATDVALYH